MYKRDFNIIKRSVEKAGLPIMDIPYLGILRYFKPEALIKRFTDNWGIKPQAVVLPIAYSDGLLFEVEGLRDLRSPNAKIAEDLKEFSDVVYAFAKEGLKIYLLLDPTLQFIRTNALHLIDIVGDSSASVCIGNPSSREVIAAILGTAIDETLNAVATLGDKQVLEGVVIDAVNIWPMGAANQRLELNCFCPSCERYFNQENDKLLPFFRDFPNPWNLLLKDTGSGIGFIDDIKQSSTADEIVGLSRQKGYYSIFEKKEPGELLKSAEILREYIRIRHEQTLFAINEIFQKALGGLPPNIMPKRVILLEGVYYGWTSGLQLDRLDRVATVNTVNPYDEIWFDPSSTDLFMKEVPFRSYMWKRSRYYVDSFLNFAANVSDPVKRSITGIARLSRTQAKELLDTRLSQAMGTAMIGQTSLFALPNLQSDNEESQRIGFVGVALDEEIGKALIESISIPRGMREHESES